MNVPMLVEKPRDYTVRFEFLSRDDGDYAAIGANDAAFGYETAAATEDQSGGDGDDAGQQQQQQQQEEPQQRLLFEGLNFGVHKDSRVAIVGRNGGGKSTLLRLLSGKLLPTEGDISIERRCVVGTYDQHFEVLHEVDAQSTSALKFLMAKFPEVKEQEGRASLGTCEQVTLTYLFTSPSHIEATTSPRIIRVAVGIRVVWCDDGFDCCCLSLQMQVCLVWQVRSTFSRCRRSPVRPTRATIIAATISLLLSQRHNAHET